MSNTAAHILAQARRNREKLAEYPCVEPSNLDEALALQDAAMAGLGDDIAGWKLGCTSAAAQVALKTDGPFFGPVPASRVFPSGAEIVLGGLSPVIVESEVALRLARDLPPDPQGYSAEQAYDAVGFVYPALEVVSRRLPGGIADGLLWNVADGGLNDALILGAGTHDLPIEELPTLKVKALINGQEVSAGLGENAMGGAHEALAWIASEFSRRGRTLRKGDVITTGLTTDILTVKPGDTFETHFSEIGTVRAQFR